MKEFKLSIINSDGTKNECMCSSLIVPTSDGQYGIMANHTPILIAVIKGKIKYTIDENEYFTDTKGAFLRFDNNEANIIMR